MSAARLASSADGTPRFGDIAAQLAENGYQPVPLHYGQKNPCAGQEWQHYRFQESDLKRFAEAGTGLLCGAVVAIDIDVRDPAIAGKLEAVAEELFGPAPRRIGQPPKVLRMMQAATPFTKLATRGYRLPADSPDAKSHRVEILASGQQFVVYNRHPDTGLPYVWNGAGDPLTMPIGLLPTLSEEDARKFIALADQMLANYGRPVGRLVEQDEGRPHASSDEQRARDPGDLRDALASIPNEDLEFDDWLRILYAIKGALGDEGLCAFLAWSAKSKKHVPANATHEYKAARPSKIGAGTIYYLAEQHGWKRPQSATAAQPSVEEPWPEAVNLFAELTAPPFEASNLPPELAAYPSLYARQTGIDASIALTAAVVTAAAAISDRIQVCADSSSRWFAQPRLWRLVIGAPGSGKSPADREMQAPLWALHREADEAWRSAVKSLPEDEPKPSRPRVIVGDATLEALSDVLAENPRGILVVTDEFDAWLGAMDQYRSGGIGRDRGEWLRLFDGGPHSIERVKRGTVFIENWGVSILTATTPAAMRRLTRHLPEDGLIQRFLVVLAGRQQIACERPERAEIDAEQARYVETIRRLWALTPRAHNGIVPLSFDAQQRFAAWRTENAALQEALGSLDSALEAHVAKYPTLALRLALTFHCVRVANHADPSARDPAAFPIPAATFETALAFLRRASQHALALYLGRKGGSETYEIARAVARFLLARPSADNARGLQRRDLLRRVFSFRDAEEGSQGAAVRLLIDLGWLRESADGYQKAQPTRFCVNPGLHERFAALAEQERERRSLIRERITEAAEGRRTGHSDA
jgi:Protein of unknown function (DUF3987)/Primase C terminal 2 (PriCT-2)/Bifunctional DNA primase/polymerase, N-terminal